MSRSRRKAILGLSDLSIREYCPARLIMMARAAKVMAGARDQRAVRTRFASDALHQINGGTMLLSHRAELTPQMLQYADKFDDRGDIRWMPYLMYFHPPDHRSEVVNTDRLGFRISHGADEQASIGGCLPQSPVRLLVGSSTAFGIGATNDAATLASRLWSRHAPSAPWLNFAGRSHNSTQELLLFLLYRHLLPRVDEIVIFSGFNDLGLARLPKSQQGDHGAFFNCGQFFDQMGQLRDRQRREKSRFGSVGRRRSEPPEAASPEASAPPSLDEQIAHAVELTTRHLDSWRPLAEASGARLSYVLQPLATWVREERAPQEDLLFDELDAISNFGEVYGDIATMESGRRYSDELRQGCGKLGVPFYDMNPVLADAVSRDDWLFVDRIHFTDEGHDIVSGLLADMLSLS
ncbi:SGNH/GDSL hydrolase family protein [Streptomyces sp. NPDC001820]|uniref:SGNH/GDSL hydrolase family protein n=1 Tax=Streptomyces sp. NPDC001820 TaxID=3364613 RepID=UPI0036C5DDBB